MGWLGLAVMGMGTYCWGGMGWNIVGLEGDWTAVCDTVDGHPSCLHVLELDAD
jgi:hypothetical protein